MTLRPRPFSPLAACAPSVLTCSVMATQASPVVVTDPEGLHDFTEVLPAPPLPRSSPLHFASHAHEWNFDTLILMLL